METLILAARLLTLIRIPVSIHQVGYSIIGPNNATEGNTKFEPGYVEQPSEMTQHGTSKIRKDISSPETQELYNILRDLEEDERMLGDHLELQNRPWSNGGRRDRLRPLNISSRTTYLRQSDILMARASSRLTSHINYVTHRFET